MKQLDDQSVAAEPLVQRFDPRDISSLKAWLAQRSDAMQLRQADLRAALIQEDAIFRLGDALRLAGASGSDILLVSDPTPMRRAGDNLKALVLQILRETAAQVRELSLPTDDQGRVQADFANVKLVMEAIGPNTAVVALGPGSVADIAKHACYQWEQERAKHVPLVMCQTANTVTAYSASMAVLAKDGVKRTWPSRYPDVVLSDLRTIADAPRSLALAGLGDCCPMFVSYADWYIAHELGFEAFYSEAALELFPNLSEDFLDSAEEIGNGSLHGAEVLARTIVLAGIAQSVVGMSRPFSGLEHVVLHLLDDVVAPFNGRCIPLHGAQAGVATLLAAAAYEEFLERFDPAAVDPGSLTVSEAAAHARVAAAFDSFDPTHAVSEGFWQEYEAKVALWNKNLDRVWTFLLGWEERRIREKIVSLLQPARTVAAILRRAGAPLLFEDLKPLVPLEQYRFAFLNAPLTRQRFTLIDLLHFLGQLDEQFFSASLERAQAAARDQR